MGEISRERESFRGYDGSTFTLDVVTARSLLRALMGIESFDDNLVLNDKIVANWLIESGLGPWAYTGCRQGYPKLAPYLQGDAFSAVAENSIHFENLAQITTSFQALNIPLVLLKGAALAESVYGGQVYRTMSDIDVWVHPSEMQQAVEQMLRLGFHPDLKEDRPHMLQLMSQGEIRFYRTDWKHNLVELHLSPFPGWWLQRTAAIDDEAVWSRIEPIGDKPGVYQLSAEDALIHFAVHTAVNHQFGLAAVRSLVDSALTVQHRSVNWQVVAKRAKKWRVATAVYQMLFLLDQIIGVPGVEQALDVLRPLPLRRSLLKQFITPQSVIAGHDIRNGYKRFMLLLLLVDRPRDMARLLYRALWPEKAWLNARYQRETSHAQHLMQVVRYGKI